MIPLMRLAIASALALALVLPATGLPAGAATLGARLVRQRLDTGLTIIAEEKSASGLVALHTWVRVGSKDESDETNGAAHFLEHMLFKGTARRKTGEMDRAIESLGGVLNAATSVDFTYYYVVGAGRDFDQLLDLQSDAIMNSTIDAGEVDRERTVVIEEISRRDNFPGTLAFEMLRAAAYTAHPYRRSVLGPRLGIARMPREVLLNFYRTHYVPANLTVVVVGSVPSRDAVAKVARVYAPFTRPAAPRPPRPAEPPITGVRRSLAEQDVRVAYLALGFPGLSVRDPDIHATDVLAYLLGRGLGGRLRQQVLERARVVQSISAFFPTQEDPALFVIQAVTDPAQVEHAEAAILAELAAVREQGVTDAELARAKNLLEGEYIYEGHTTRGRAYDLGLASTIADLEFAQTYLERIRRVTREDVQRVARRVLDPDRYAVAVVRPRSR
ncbi:MAG: M16 family metallopeptidase, partial [Pseudomonadota bacterium]